MQNFLKIFFFTFSIASVHGQNLKELSGSLNKIKKINEVQYEHVGYGGIQSENFKNYLNLKTKANITQLIKLTIDSNGVVACYASWALIDKSFDDLPSILIKFLNEDKYVTTFRGCIKSSDPLSSEFYHRYWNSVSEKATDKTLFTLDSLILYNDNCYWLLITRALKDRVYPASFSKRIEYLAFTKANMDAITYLKKLNNETYNEPIKQATIKYFEETNFSNVGIDVYLETIHDLLNYNDETIKPLVIQKLKNDTFWKSFEKEFSAVLIKYGIHLTDLK